VEIKENAVYTREESQKLLKVSQSTMMRLIKNGIIRCAKVGKQHRIMGKELLRLVSPELEDKAGKIYNKGREWLHEGIDE
jgi:excisionase family DNA binding protein